jgi:hypothetical protein
MPPNRTYPQAATVHRLQPKGAKLEAERAGYLRQLVLSLDLPDGPVRQIVAAIDRQTAAENGWTFVMISPVAYAAVVRHLLEHSKRPKVAVNVWTTCFTHLRHDTGEVVASQAELADELGVQRQHVNAALSELVELNALVKWRVGREVRYGINPNVGTSLSGKHREIAQKQAGPLRLVT